MTLHAKRVGRAGLVAAVGAATVLGVGFTSTGTAAAQDRASASVSQGTLTVTGTEQSDNIALLLAPRAPGTLQVDFGDDGSPEFSFDRSTFSRINVFAGDGNDHVRINQVNGAFADERVTIDGGNGNDIIEGGDGNELLLGGPGNDFIDGNRGADTAFLGSGNDTFRWDAGDGSDVVEGESGFDTLEFNGAPVAENMTLSANGRRALLVRDIGNIRMDINGIERVNVNPLGGPDNFRVGDLSGTDISVVNANLSAPGGGADGQADNVQVNGTERNDDVHVGVRHHNGVKVNGLPARVRITGSETADHLQVNTLGGRDHVSVERRVGALIGVSVDLGADQ